MPSHDLIPAGGFPWQPTPSAQTLAPPVTAGNLLHSLRRRWWIGAGLGILGAVVAALAAWNLVPTRETVSSTLHVRRQDDLSVGSSGRAATAEEVNANKLTQAGLIKQRLNLTRALESRDPDTGFDLWKSPEVRTKADPVGWLEKELKVDFFEGSDLMLVSLRGEDPKELAKIVNAIVDVYLDEAKTRQNADLAKLRGDIDSKLEEARKNLDDSHRTLNNIATQLGVGDGAALSAAQHAKSGVVSTLRQQVSLYERELMNAKREIARIEIELNLLRTRDIAEHEIEAALMKDSVYVDKLKLLHAMQTAAKQSAGLLKDPTSNKAKQALARLKALEDEVEAYRDTARPNIEASLVNPQQELQLKETLASLQSQREEIEQGLAAKTNELKTLEGELLNMGTRTHDLSIHEHRKNNHMQAVNELEATKRKLDLLATQPARVQRLVPARLPESTSQLLRYMALALAATFGFGFPIVAITFWDFQQHRVNHPNDTSTALGTKILGALPSVAGRKGRKVADQGQNKFGVSALQRSLADAVDGVRTALLRDTASEGTRVVLVTSAVHHEGKTTLATQLAASLARAGKRTLLIDGDLRKPVAHRLYGLSLDPGVCEVLRGECELEETLRPTRVSGLWMMTAGRCDEESLHELAREGADDAFTQLRSAFDYIVIDASPVLASADALVIGQYVDAAIISVLRDASRVPKVYEACDRLRGVGVRVMGTVFNGSKQDIKPVTTSGKRLPSKAAAL